MAGGPDLPRWATLRHVGQHVPCPRRKARLCSPPFARLFPAYATALSGGRRPWGARCDAQAPPAAAGRSTRLFPEARRSVRLHRRTLRRAGKHGSCRHLQLCRAVQAAPVLRTARLRLYTRGRANARRAGTSSCCRQAYSTLPRSATGKTLPRSATCACTGAAGTSSCCRQAYSTAKARPGRARRSQETAAAEEGKRRCRAAKAAMSVHASLRASTPFHGRRDRRSRELTGGAWSSGIDRVTRSTITSVCRRQGGGWRRKAEGGRKQPRQSAGATSGRDTATRTCSADLASALSTAKATTTSLSLHPPPFPPPPLSLPFSLSLSPPPPSLSFLSPSLSSSLPPSLPPLPLSESLSRTPGDGRSA